MAAGNPNKVLDINTLYRIGHSTISPFVVAWILAILVGFMAYGWAIGDVLMFPPVLVTSCLLALSLVCYLGAATLRRRATTGSN
ncbi:MAG: hypothetical protein Q4A92_06970 [Corynebacterium sp.]|nr:hypothetical protein [Corynebacterium sp.]